MRSAEDPLPVRMILAHGALVQWIRFFIWHTPCPVGSKNLDLCAHTHLCGLLKKWKPHGSDWRLFSRLLWSHPSDHPQFLHLKIGKQKNWSFTLKFDEYKKRCLSWVELSTVVTKSSIRGLGRRVVET
jgi:hypothetical protein